MTRIATRVSVRLSFVVATTLISFSSLAAQQSVEADKVLLATERYVKPPAE